jgi:gas vesicle protein
MENKEGKFILGAMFGAMVGAVAGILLAPRSGKETRKILGDKTKECTENCKEMFDKGKEVAKEKIKETADSISKQMDK